MSALFHERSTVAYVSSGHLMHILTQSLNLLPWRMYCVSKYSA